jgi:hypothetical protein
VADHNKIAARTATKAAEMDDYVKSRVKGPGEPVGIGDVVIPESGAFKGTPLWVNGMGGKEMKYQLTPGVGPGFGHKGKVAFLVAETIYKKGDFAGGQTTGVRFNLPLSELGKSKTKNQLGQSGRTFNNGGSDMTDTEREEIIDGLIENSCCWTENDREELEGLSDIALQKTLQAAEKAVENEELLAAAEKGFNDGRDDLAYNREKRVWEKKEKPVTTNATAPVKPELSDEDKAILNYGREMMAKEKADLIERLTQNAGEAKAAQAKVYEGLAIEQLRSIAPPAKAPAQNFYGPEVTNAKKVNREDMFVPTDIDFVANSAFAK